MKIAVLGAGAMGSWFGGLLADNGNPVQLLTTNVAHRNAINNKGLLLSGPFGEKRVPVEALDPTQVQAPLELILVMTKTFQTCTAIQSVAHAIDDNTQLLSLQNGLGNAENLSTVVPLERIWIGVSMMPINKTAPGVVVGKGQGASYFGSALPMDKAVANTTALAIEQTFRAANIDLSLDSQIHKRIWEKLAFNAGMNALCALSNGTPGSIDSLPEAKSLAQAVAIETSAVATTQKITIDMQSVLNMIELSCTKHSAHVPSMLQDIRSKRLTEVSALNGAIAQVGKANGVAVPLNDTLATLIRLTEQAYQT